MWNKSSELCRPAPSTPRSLLPLLLLAGLQSRGSAAVAAAAHRIPHGGQKQRNILFERRSPPHAAGFDSPSGCETDGATFPVFPAHFLWIPQPAQRRFLLFTCCNRELSDSESVAIALRLQGKLSLPQNVRNGVICTFMCTFH